MAKKQRTELDIDDDIPAAPPPEPEQEPSPPPSEPELPDDDTDAAAKKKKLIIIVAAAVTTLIVVVALLYFFVFKGESEGKPKAKEVTAVATPTPKPVVADKPKAAPIHIYTFAPFLIPIKGRDGADHFIRVSFATEMSGPEVKKEIDRNLVLVRENIFTLVKSATENDFRSTPKRKKLLVDIAIAVNRSIQSGAVLEALVTEMTIL